MSEIWTTWVYKFNFSESVNTDYVYVATCPWYNNIGWVVYQDELTRLSGWWGGSIQLSWVDTKLAKIIEELTKEAPETPEKEIDFTPILDKIDSIEIPETKLEEKEAKKALKLIEKLSKDFTSYIDKEMSEKEQLGAITREFTRIEMEHNEKKMKHEEEMRQKEIEDKKREEEEKKMEEENDKKLLEEIKSEFDKLEEEDKAEKKKELEMELKEMEKEMKEKEKELKKL